MPGLRASRLVVPTVAVVIVLALLWDAIGRHRAHQETVPAGAGALPSGGDTGAAVPGSGPAPGAEAAPARSPADRAAARARIRDGSSGSYLARMVEGADSIVRHWGARGGRPIRVAVVPWTAAGYRDDYAGAVQWAMVRWNGVGLPVQFESTRDSAGADVVVTWVDTLGGEAAGQARMAWIGTG
jgi:hypothetical protein